MLVDDHIVGLKISEDDVLGVESLDPKQDFLGVQSCFVL